MVKIHHLVLAALFATVGCDKHRVEPAPAPSPKLAPAVVVPAPVSATTTEAFAAREGGGSCAGEMKAGGECAGGCGQWDEAASEVARRPIPTDARWEQIAVEGMTCGGCERRVIANVGQLDGVLAVEADAELGQVRVATAAGRDLREAAIERINSLGYRAR